MVSSVAASLQERGIVAGDVVGVQLPNCWQFVVASVATTRIGAVVMPLSMSYRRAELGPMLAAAGASCLFASREHRGREQLSLAVEVAAATSALRQIVVVGDAPTPAESAQADDFALDAFDDLLARPAAQALPTTPSPSSPALLLFTSGTEAMPKGVVHTHNTANFSLGVCSDLWGLTADDKVLVAAPMGHGAGYQWCHRIALHQGATQVLMDRWDGEEAAALVMATGASFTYAPTRFLLDLVTVAAVARSRVGMKSFASGGAPIPTVLVEQAQEVLGAKVFATYGQTECFVATSTGRDDPIEEITGSDGRALPGVTVRIVDEGGNELPAGEVGECITRGPHVAGGYLDGTAPGQSSFREDGWLWTGDRCVMNADGYMRVLGRTREMIIRNGLNVSPAEVESYVLELDSVDAVAVVGQEDPKVGERTCAFVVARPGATVTLDEVVAHFAQRDVAKYKWPEALHCVDELPYSSVGKIQRSRLKELLAGALPTTYAPPTTAERTGL